MAEFYREAGEDGLWVHSDRGLLALLFLKTMQGNPAWLLEAATNGEGKTLGAVLGACSTHAAVDRVRTREEARVWVPRRRSVLRGRKRADSEVIRLHRGEAA